MSFDNETRNIAQTLADVLPEAKELQTFEPKGVENFSVHHYAVPKGTDVKELKIDLEALLPNPRRTRATATFADAASFLAYVARHADERSVTWCDFDPQNFALRFTAVIDEHAKDAAGWRAHQAVFEPKMSAEWKVWKAQDSQLTPQIEFATFLQDNEDDINSSDEKFPTSLQMHKLATEFVMNEERVLKSTIRLQSGGVRLTYIADPESGATDSMEMFEKFRIAIPVFHGDSTAWALIARLKYRQHQGSVKFAYELQRADKVHKAASEELINTIRSGLASVPLLMGACK